MQKNIFQVTVNNTDPIAFYCTVASHCQSGMVGVVNPSSSDSLEKYLSAAKDSKASSAPPAMFGGKMVESTTDSTATGTASGTATGAAPTKTGAASHLQASLGGIGAVALGFAAFVM
jgi:hypothetical protein